MPLLADLTHAVPGPDGPGGEVGDALGSWLGDELDDGLDDGAELGRGSGDDAGPDCTDHWTGTDLAGHFGVAAIDTRVSFPDARQAWMVTAWPDAPPCAPARFSVSEVRLFAAAYPPKAAATIRHSTAASRTSFLDIA